MYSVSDVTALWNTNAFFAYVSNVTVFQLSWEPRRLWAVVIATFGVFVVVYGGSTSPKTDVPTATSPLIGDLMTLFASVLYGLYQVLYKKYAALPSDPELLSDRLYQRIPSSAESYPEEVAPTKELPEPPSFGLHPDLLTSLMGLATFVLLWIPLPILHYFGIERFSIPSDTVTILVLAGAALSGVVFNAGFMVCTILKLDILILSLTDYLPCRFCLAYGVLLLHLQEICSPSSLY